MTLGTHAVVGAAVASFLPHQPVLAFVGGFLSHFVLDSIPHWDYKILSLKKDLKDKMNNDIIISRKFCIDLARGSLDILIGIMIGLFLFHQYNTLFILLIGSVGGMFPDFLQFAYFKAKREPLTSLQKFHNFIHAKKRLKDPFTGILYQVGVVLIIYLLVICLK